MFGNQAHGGDDVAHRNIVGALRLIFLLDQGMDILAPPFQVQGDLAHGLVGAIAQIAQALLQPRQKGGGRRLAQDLRHGGAFAGKNGRARAAAPASASATRARTIWVSRRKFSTRAMRSVMGTAHNSPMVSGVTS